MIEVRVQAESFDCGAELGRLESLGAGGLASLWAAAGLTLITGWDYLRVGLKHMD